jgi:hypothetical protein
MYRCALVRIGVFRGASVLLCFAVLCCESVCWRMSWCVCAGVCAGVYQSVLVADVHRRWCVLLWIGVSGCVGVCIGVCAGMYRFVCFVEEHRCCCESVCWRMSWCVSVLVCVCVCVRTCERRVACLGCWCSTD